MTNLFFHTDGFISSGFLNFSPKEAYSETLAGEIIVDVREEYLIGYKKFDVGLVIYISFSQLNERFSELPRDKGLIIADSTGIFSKEAFLLLQSKGFSNIANLAGGIVEWERDGMPLKIDNSERLDGSCTCQLKKRNKPKP